MRPASIFAELKQRRIVRILVSYAVSGWVALEVVGAFVERGLAPEIVYRVGLVLYLGGFFLTGVLGWYHGEKGRQHTTPAEIFVLILIGLATAVGGVQTVRSAGAAALAERAGVAGALPLNRIGVLYFDDRSGGELGYLADGLTETLIDRLDAVQGLRVISTSGVAPFRDSDLPLDSIASILSAGTLLRGSVAPRGDRVRVDLELVDGESGAPLESHVLERPAEDLLRLQEEMAEEVAIVLRGWLGREVTLRRTRDQTERVDAWTAFQRAERARKDADEHRQRSDMAGFVEAWRHADSLFAAAARLDPAWSQPLVLRASLATTWASLSVRESPSEARQSVVRGLGLAEEALRLDPRSADAYYARGLLRYLRWRYGLTDDPADAEATFAAAVADLEAAVGEDPSHASAWNALSVLRSEQVDLVGANLAARRAWEADEFLTSAESVLRTLYTTSYDLANFKDAIRYCEEGGRRFPESPVFTECGLWLMGTRAVEPDPTRAWELLERYVALRPEQERELARIRGQILVANVLARAGLADSARAVLSRSQASPAIDPTRELLGYEALAHLQLGDTATAIDRLRMYLTASPEHREGWRWTSHWWWQGLQGDPEFRRLIGN